MRLPCASLPWVLRSIDKFLCLAGADVPAHDTEKNSRIIDLDVDIGADAVDYKYVLLAAVALRFFVFVFSDVFFCCFPFSAQSPTKNHYRDSKRRCASWRELSRKS